MHIHLVTDEFSLGGGIEHIYQIAKGLKDISFRIFGRTGEAVGKFRGLENVEICDKGFAPAYLTAKEPRLLHFHHLKPLAAFFRSPFKHYRIPTVFTAHGLHIHKYEFYNSLRGRLNYFLRFQLEKRLLPRVGRVITVSREDKRFLEEKYHLKNVAYLTNGIDFSAVHIEQGAAREELRKKLNLPLDRFLFVTVARFNFQKGYDLLLRAIAMVKEAVKARSGYFIFVGDGPEFEKMKHLGQSLGISGDILFLGARSDVYDILRASDVCLLPSRWEGLPIVLLETGLLKVPVIASDTYGNREIIGEKNGILFKNLNIDALAGVIRDVLNDRYDLKGYAENLYKEVRLNYNLEKMLNGLRAIYE